MIETKVIEDLDSFMNLGPAWDELVSGTEVNHAFMKHLWFVEWIRAFALGDRLSIITIWSDRQLVAAAPLRRTIFGFRGIKARGLGFLWSPVSPRCNLIVAEDAWVEPLTERILKLSRWDVFLAKNMESGLDSTQRFIALLGDRRNRTALQIEDGFQSPFMLTEGEFDEYWNNLPKKRRSYLERMCMRRLEKADKFEISQITTAGQFVDFAPEMFEISSRSWKAVSGDHLRMDTPEGRFYCNFTPTAIDRGLVTLYTIDINGKRIGFEYLLSCNSKYSLIRCDYDEDFKYYSPGSNLRLAVVKDLFERNHTCEYDLGGDAYPYKLEWCKSIRKHVSFTMSGGSLRGNAILFAKGNILPPLRRVGVDPRRRKKPIW